MIKIFFMMSVIILYCQCFKHHFLIKVRHFKNKTRYTTGDDKFVWVFDGSDAAKVIADPGAGDGGPVVGGLGPLQGLRLCWRQHYSREEQWHRGTECCVTRGCVQ